MKSLRERFEENYAAVAVDSNNKKGFKIKYVYYAPWYKYEISDSKLTQKKCLYGAAIALSVILFFCGSLLDTPLNYVLYVELPGTVALAAMVLSLVTVVKFCAQSRKMTKMNYQEISRDMKLFPYLQAILLLITTGGCVYYITIDDCAAINYIALFCYAMSAICVFWIGRDYSKLCFATEKNSALENGRDLRIHSEEQPG